MKKVLLLVIGAKLGVMVLSAYSTAQEEGTGVTANKSFEEAYKMLAEETKAKITAHTSIEEHYEILHEYIKLVDKEVGARILPGLPSEEYIKLELERVKALAAVPEPSIKTFCKRLEERFDDPGTVNFIMGRIYYTDSYNFASNGNQEALYWARRIIREKTSEFNKGAAMGYLALRGEAGDLDLLSSDAKDTLKMRLAGTNIVNYRTSLVSEGFSWTGCVPSVTNTGPQALYVQEILRQAWEILEVEERIGRGGFPHPFRDKSQIPPELITMVVWFDKDGNPVCNVDLAKYGLTMPEIDLPQNVRDEILRRARPNVATASLPSADDAPPNRLWLYTALLAILCATVALWLIRKKR